MRSLLLSSLFSLSLLLTGRCAMAQSDHTISGKVTDENQKPLAGATIFVDGSQIATATNEAGYFQIKVPGAGSYRLSAKILGYAADTKDVMLREQSANLDFSLKIKPVVLSQVNIGSDKTWAKNFGIFKTQFLGTTPNAMACKIINPGVINFSTKTNVLNADADDFLIIENPLLGYRIKYLLKTFHYSKTFARTFYDGEVIFEELPGTDAQKQNWAKNRHQAYQGSMMHFLRSLFTNTALQEGFIAERIIRDYTDGKPINFQDYVTATDTSFITFHSLSMQVDYNPKKATKLLEKYIPGAQSVPQAEAGYTKYESQLRTNGEDVIVDARGRVYSGYLLTFLIRGDWTYYRVADQLPFEYQPPAQPSSP